MYHVTHLSLVCCQTKIYWSALTTKYNWGWWEFTLFLHVTGHELLRNFNLNRTSPPANGAKAKVIKIHSLGAMNICLKCIVNSSSYLKEDLSLENILTHIILYSILLSCIMLWKQLTQSVVSFCQKIRPKVRK